MLSRRLSAHSGDKVKTLASICELDPRRRIDDMVVLFSQGSPRNIIRICKEILDQQSEFDSTSCKLSANAVTQGFEIFAKNYTNEILPEAVVKIFENLSARILQ